MVSFNATLLAQILNFFLLLFLLDRLFFRKLAAHLADRRLFLRLAEEQTARQFAEISTLQTEYQAGLDKARAEAQAVIKAQLATAEAERGRQLAAVRAEVDSQLSQLRAELAAQREAAAAAARQDLADLAGEIARKATQLTRQPALR